MTGGLAVCEYIEVMQSRMQFYPFATKYVMTLGVFGYSPSTQVFLLDYSLSFNCETYLLCCMASVLQQVFVSQDLVYQTAYVLPS